jgi:hypothetical protein
VLHIFHFIGAIGMAFLRDVVSSAHQFFWGNLGINTNAPKKTLEEIFKENLSVFATTSIGLKCCIKNCCNSVDDVLQKMDYDLSEASQKKIEGYVQQFNHAVESSNDLTPDMRNDLKSEFKRSLRGIVEEKWVILMAKSFYPILGSTKNQIMNAQQWAEQFFVGEDCFNKWSGGTISQPDMVKIMLSKVVSAFNDYSLEVIQQKMARMAALAEKDFVTFGKKMEQVAAKAKNDFNSLTMEEAEFVEYSGYLVRSSRGNWPEIALGKNVMTICITEEYDSRNSKTPKSAEQRYDRFAEIFSIDQN